ncbi:exotoxin [Yersinia alsatica]|uniref:exotoxin n=1 Tax=Yersinia alsatica TaxID=2890317 RepID=UPI001643EC6D|nr:exotoxin [Yersinia alsatica]
MSGKLITALIAVLIAIFTGLSWIAFHYHSQSVEKDAVITTVTSERDVAQFTLGNYTTSVRIFNDIAKANEDAKSQITLVSQRTKADIKTAIANNDCTNRLVPAGAIDRLREHSNKIRNRPASANPEQLTF